MIKLAGLVATETGEAQGNRTDHPQQLHEGNADLEVKGEGLTLSDRHQLRHKHPEKEDGDQRQQGDECKGSQGFPLTMAVDHPPIGMIRIDNRQQTKQGIKTNNQRMEGLDH